MFRSIIAYMKRFSDVYKKYFKIYFSSDFGYISKKCILKYPIVFTNPKNVFLYENTNIYSGSLIASTRARFIMKANSGAAQGLTVMFTPDEILEHEKIYPVKMRLSRELI